MMTKIKITLSVVCEDEALASKVQTEYFPSMDDLMRVPGVSEVSSEWLAEREQ